MGSPPPVGFGFSQYAVAGAYATPIASFSSMSVHDYYTQLVMFRLPSFWASSLDVT